MTIDEILARFKGVRPSGSGWTALCSAHADTRSSLSIAEKPSGHKVLKCHRGCPINAVTAAAGLTMADLMPDDAQAPMKRGRPKIAAAYDYTDEAGTLLYQVCRFEPKDFRQRRPDPTRPGKYLWNLDGVRRVLYRLPDLKRQRRVLIVEGEKDVDRAWAAGFAATTNAGGAKKWGLHATDYFDQLSKAGVFELVVIPDNDEPGRAHAREIVRRALDYGGFDVRVLELPEVPPKGDLTDFLSLPGCERCRN